MSSPDREATIRELFARLSAHEWESAGLLDRRRRGVRAGVRAGGHGHARARRAALVSLYASILGPMFDTFTIAPDEIILGADPDVAVVTYASDAVVKHNGKPYRNRYVGIFRFRGGEIVAWREYHNPEETGARPRLAAILECARLSPACSGRFLGPGLLCSCQGAGGEVRSGDVAGQGLAREGGGSP